MCLIEFFKNTWVLVFSLIYYINDINSSEQTDIFDLHIGFVHSGPHFFYLSHTNFIALNNITVNV